MKLQKHFSVGLLQKLLLGGIPAVVFQPKGNFFLSGKESVFMLNKSWYIMPALSSSLLGIIVWFPNTNVNVMLPCNFSTGGNKKAWDAL